MTHKVQQKFVGADVPSALPMKLTWNGPNYKPEPYTIKIEFDDYEYAGDEFLSIRCEGVYVVQTALLKSSDEWSDEAHENFGPHLKGQAPLSDRFLELLDVLLQAHIKAKYCFGLSPELA